VNSSNLHASRALIRASRNIPPEYKEKKMANKEQKSNANTKKEPKLNLKEKRLAKQEKAANKKKD